MAQTRIAMERVGCRGFSGDGVTCSRRVDLPFRVVPRTAGSRRGFLFWEAIAEYETGRQYSDDLGTISIPTLLQVKAEHCHELARICRRKYKVLRVAFWISMVGFAASLVVFLFAQPVTTAHG